VDVCIIRIDILHVFLCPLSTYYQFYFIFLTRLASLFALAFYDPNPLSTQLEAKAHGRHDFILLAIQTVMVLVLSIFPSNFSSWVLIFVMIGAGFFWLASTIFFMAYYNHRVNLVCIFRN
jgi:hypothetical protein